MHDALVTVQCICTGAASFCQITTEYLSSFDVLLLNICSFRIVTVKAFKMFPCAMKKTAFFYVRGVDEFGKCPLNEAAMKRQDYRFNMEEYCLNFSGKSSGAVSTHSLDQ